MLSFYVSRLRKNGFTLVEILATTGLIALISATVFVTLINGFTLWRSVHTEMPEADVAIFFEKCTQEFENVFVCDGASFEGTATWVKFPVSLKHLRRSGAWSMGAVRYAYSHESGMLTRATYSISDIFQGLEPAPEVIFNHVPGASFAYYYNDSGANNYLWLDEWPPKNVEGAAVPRWPEAIKIRFQWEQNGKVLENERIIPIPLAQK